LPEDLPVYGVRASVLDDEAVESISVEEMAEIYLKEIRAVQPKGPYRLCGFSFGGVMAFELARRFKEAGEEVEFLGILDAATYALRLDWTARERLAQIGRRVSYRLSVLSNQGGWSLAAYLRQRAAIIRQQYLRRAKNEVHKGVANWIAPERRKAALVLQKSVLNYSPGPYSGSAVLFRSRDRRDIGDFDPQNGWGKLVSGPIDVYEFDGNHVTFIKEPTALQVADKLNELLGACDARADHLVESSVDKRSGR
jgi:acetoacetyl-CoA synthetase